MYRGVDTIARTPAMFEFADNEPLFQGATLRLFDE